MSTVLTTVYISTSAPATASTCDPEAPAPKCVPDAPESSSVTKSASDRLIPNMYKAKSLYPANSMLKLDSFANSKVMIMKNYILVFFRVLELIIKRINVIITELQSSSPDIISDDESTELHKFIDDIQYVIHLYVSYHAGYKLLNVSLLDDLFNNLYRFNKYMTSGEQSLKHRLDYSRSAITNVDPSSERFIIANKDNVCDGIMAMQLRVIDISRLIKNESITADMNIHYDPRTLSVCV